MKYIRHRKDGRWEYRRQINGVHYQIINKDREIVRQYGTDLNKKLKGSVADFKGSLTFADYAEEYYELFKQRKAGDSSQEEWRTALKIFRQNFSKNIKTYTADDFQRFLNNTAEKSQNTAKKMFNKIRAICQKAFASGIIKINIAEIIEKPEYTEKHRRALTVFEQVRFLNFAKHEDVDTWCFFIFCLVTSARREEAVKYKPSDLNRKNNMLFVNGTKTLNAPRTIRVSQQFVDEVLNKIGNGFKHTSDYYSRVAKKIFEKMGCPDLVLNCLRHTCATNMVYLDIPAEYRKHIMGHSTIITTDRVYTHIDMSVRKSRIKLIYKDLYFCDF